MSIVPVLQADERPTNAANSLLALGFSALIIVGSSSGQIHNSVLRAPMSSSNLAPGSAQRNVVLPPAVRAGAPMVGRSTASLLVEAHQASGLTWDQIARFFGVSRRAVHLWASGGRMAASNEELLAHLLRAVDSVKHLDPFDRRQALLDSSSGLNIVDSERAKRSSRDTDINRSPETGVAVDQV